MLRQPHKRGRMVWLTQHPGEGEPLAELPWVAADCLRRGPVRMLRTLRDALAADVEERLPQVRLPVLLVRGRGDPVAPQPWLEHAADLLPDATVAVVPAAHAVDDSHPRELAAVVASSLDRAGPDAARARPGGAAPQ